MSFGTGTTSRGLELINQEDSMCAYFDIGGLRSSPWNYSDIEWNIRTPLPVLAALLHALNITELGNDWKEDLR